jgi:hypothetical protein
MEEILHQLIGGFISIIGFQPSKVGQDFATINSRILTTILVTPMGETEMGSRTLLAV